jgi:hypothetical protein
MMTMLMWKKRIPREVPGRAKVVVVVVAVMRRMLFCIISGAVTSDIYKSLSFGRLLLHLDIAHLFVLIYQTRIL